MTSMRPANVYHGHGRTRIHYWDLLMANPFGKSLCKEAEDGEPHQASCLYHPPPHHTTVDNSRLCGTRLLCDGTCITKLTSSQ